MSVPERYCDIVMKGGVTSGIIYPFAITKLSAHYSFKNIGGTSAGAIAAAAAAAAEYQRRCTESDKGFEELALLPNNLSLTDDRERSKLLRLFQPQPRTKPLFTMLISLLNRRSALSRFYHLILAGLTAFPGASFIGTLTVGAITWLFYRPSIPVIVCSGTLCWTSWLPIGLLAALGALCGLAIAVYRCIAVDVVANGFGLCRGHAAQTRFTKVDGKRVVDDPLTDWLHTLINNAAGRETVDSPLTFGELWSAPGFPPQWLAAYSSAPVRSIDLQMMTTNVTHGRPYRLPFQDPDSKLFFRPDELENYFPPIVVEWMLKHKGAYEPTASDPESLPEGLYPIPSAEHMPVVVAARLSLSYPVLISAVPLWAIDYEAPRQERSFERCWFSDGGISSNFPVHFFDGLLPLWPTFGLKLEGFPKGYKDEENRIYMPFRNVEGRADGWSRFDEKAGFERFTGFVSAVVDSMMNWNDNTLSKIPGFRDRIVRVRLTEHEGGMNLGMGVEKIEALSNLGSYAAEEILERFLYERPVGPEEEAMGWENHRWVRLRSLVAVLERTIPQLRAVVEVAPPGAPAYNIQVAGAMGRLPDQQPLQDQAQIEMVLKAIENISVITKVLERTAETRSTAPQPLPALRMRPNL